MEKKPLVYFLCTGNSCRSQIAEGFLKALGSDRYEVKSASLNVSEISNTELKEMRTAL